MGTKNNPGQFDCYANAKPDEPMFILLGRDRDMALLVRLWVLLKHRRGDVSDEPQIQEALQCASDAHHYAAALGKMKDRDSALDDALLFAATEGMDEHPDGFDDSCMCDLCKSYA